MRKSIWMVFRGLFVISLQAPVCVGIFQYTSKDWADGRCERRVSEASGHSRWPFQPRLHLTASQSGSPRADLLTFSRLTWKGKDSYHFWDAEKSAMSSFPLPRISVVLLLLEFCLECRASPRPREKGASPTQSQEGSFLSTNPLKFFLTLLLGNLPGSVAPSFLCDLPTRYEAFYSKYMHLLILCLMPIPAMILFPLSPFSPPLPPVFLLPPLLFVFAFPSPFSCSLLPIALTAPQLFFQRTEWSSSILPHL